MDYLLSYRCNTLLTTKTYYAKKKAKTFVYTTSSAGFGTGVYQKPLCVRRKTSRAGFDPESHRNTSKDMVPKQKNKMEKGSQRRNGNCFDGQQEALEKQLSRQTRSSAFLCNDQSAKLYDSAAV